MIFNSRISIYQQTKSFDHGESVITYTYLDNLPLFCHLKFKGTEHLSAERKQPIRQVKVTYEISPVVLVARDILLIDSVYFRLLYDPMPRKGLSNRTFYEVEIVEAFDVVVV